MIVFIDDSGDPGFKIEKGSSSFFVIALVVFDDFLEAEKTSLAIKQLRRQLGVSDRFEFKFNKTNRKFRNNFFDTVKDFDFNVRAIVVDKKRITSNFLRTNKENFYNYVIMQVFKQSRGRIKNAKLRFDRHGERAIRDQLRVYLSKALDNKNKNIFKDLKFVDSKQNTLIQLADMVVGCIRIAYTGKNKEYLAELKKSGRIEDIWDFK